MDHIPSDRILGEIRRWKDLPALARAARKRTIDHAMYFHFKPGVKRYVPLALKPWVVTSGQRRALRALCMTLEGAARRLLELRMSAPDLDELLPLTEGELDWIRDAYRGRWRRPETFFSRMDLLTDLGAAGWLERAKFLEANFVGIGATYYCWSAGRIAHELFSPRLEKAVGPLEPEDDILEMIHRRCRSHGRRIGRPDPVVAFVEQKTVEHGPFEYQTMERIYRDRGRRVVVADPAELNVRRGELYAGRDRVDLLYRDPTLLEFVEMETEGHDTKALRFAFRENRVVSTLGGEMDHKAIFELFSSPRWARLFRPRERDVFRKHVPWTRLLRDARVDGVDLLPHVRRERERLILKPNRDYGGTGICVGSLCTAAEWDRAIEGALGRAVVQERLPFVRDVYPVVEGGRVNFEPRYVIAGLHAGADESVFLGRMSKEPIVNITRGGAIVGVLVAKE